MRLTLTAIILLLLGAIGVWVVNDSSSEMEETVEAVESVEVEFGTNSPVTRFVAKESGPLVQPTDEDCDKHHSLEPSAVQSCLELKTYKDCLFGIDLAIVSPGEVARILELEHIKPWARAYFLSQVLLAHGPSDFSSFCEKVFESMSGRFNARASWFASAVRVLNSDHGEWLNAIGNGIPSREIFAEGSSDLLVVFLSNIENKSEHLDEILRRGARGEFGGTSSQISRAYQLYMNDLMTETPMAAFHFAERILESPHLSIEASNSIAQDSLFCVSRLSKDGEVEAEAVEDYLNSLLRNPRFQVGFAVQFLADYSTRPFPGIEENVSNEIRRESQRVMDSRY